MLWAIACYFNPAGYQRRRTNYKAFRRRLQVPLVTVEWSPTGEFVLGTADADCLIQVQGGDVLWQKERLLNLALDALPSDCDAVAWLDSDVILQDSAWAERAEEALQQHRLVQLFEHQYHLPEDADPDQLSGLETPDSRSIVAMWEEGELAAFDREGPEALRSTPCWGMGWAAPKALLAEHKLYDACIVGSGDYAIWSGAVGRWNECMNFLHMDEPRRRHYLQWAQGFNAAIDGRVGHLSGDVYHLWHGDLALRQYVERHEETRPFTFDPEEDITLTDQGCWQWSSEKPALHAWLKAYFQERCEDGRTA